MKKVIYGYWGTWSHYRPGNGQFRITDIDPTLFTHLGYAFFGLNENDEIRSLDTWLDIDLGNIAKFIALKKVNPDLKVMACIGGWNEGSLKYSAMASNEKRRSTFINSVIKFLQLYGFDGLDFDWEYPVQRGGNANDRANFVILLKELNTALKNHNFLLTVAVAAGEASASLSYDISSFSKYVDFINVMTYDFSGSWDRKTGFNAPLEGSGSNNVKSSINFWLQNGAPADKLVLGLPLYGRSFTLENIAQNGPGSPIICGGNPGPYTREMGFLGFNEICENLTAGWTRVWDSTHMVPYAYNNNQWVGYDDIESISLKINYLKSLNLAGAMIWSIETDDFHGTSGTKFPLINAIKKGLE